MDFQNIAKYLRIGLLPAIILAAASNTTALAQNSSAPTDAVPCSRAHAEQPGTVQTFYLKNLSRQSEANEVLVALRNMLCPSTKIYMVSNQSAIVITAPHEDLQQAQKLIQELDRPHKSYRLVYTLTEVDGSRRTERQHIALVTAAGQRAVLKQGNKIPVAVSSKDDPAQVTYLDVGINVDTTVWPIANGINMRYKVEQSSASDEKSGLGPKDPIVRQTLIDGTADVPAGRQHVLGSVDLPGSTARLELAVTVEPLP